jgi:hypothetical protein
MDEMEPKDKASMENELEPQQYTAANPRHFPKNRIKYRRKKHQLQIISGLVLPRRRRRPPQPPPVEAAS